MSESAGTKTGFAGVVLLVVSAVAVAAGVTLGPVGLTYLEWRREQRALALLDRRVLT